MSVKIRIVRKDIVLDAELFDTETAKSIGDGSAETGNRKSELVAGPPFFENRPCFC